MINKKLEYVKKLKNKKHNKKKAKEFKVDRDGHLYWVKMIEVPIYDENEQEIGCASVQFDITEYKKFEELAITDGLTGLYNRRYFNEILTREINRANRVKTTLSFMMLDIDYFKKYNDSYGHDAGDKALIAVSNAFKNSMHRGGDFVFRLGGEEFGILFTQTSKEGSMKMAEKVRQAIVDLNIEHSNSITAKYVTVSIGLLVIDFEKEGVDENGFYTMADDALYQAKDSGRNRVVLYENDEIEFF